MEPMQRRYWDGLSDHYQRVMEISTDDFHYGPQIPGESRLHLLPPLKPGDILLHGHTHVSVCRKHDTYTCCNPGSVSIPKENTPRGYMILENSIFTWKTLDGTEYMKLDIEE